MKRLVVIALAASAALSAAPAYAGSQSVHFVGNRAVECSVTGYSGTISFGNLGRNGQASPVTDGGISLFCNQPFHASVKSTNGYLKLQTANSANDSQSESIFTSQANPQFDAGLDYQAAISGIGTVNSGMATGGTDYNLGNHAAANLSGGTIQYTTINSDKPLLGGTYSDIVTLTLTPQGV